jgi:hypothetical protein
MNDESIEEISPIMAARPLRAIGLRRSPSYGQLMRWAAWSRRMGQNRKSPDGEGVEKNPANEGEIIDETV